MKKIVFFINTLGSGGAEHQLTILADGLVERGHDVTIATFGDIEDHYDFNPKIKRYRIAPGKNKVVKMVAIWKYFLTVEADWVVGFGQRESRYMLDVLQLRSRKKIHAVAGERNTTIGFPSEHEKKLMNKLYRRADYIVPNSFAQRKHIVETRPEFESKTVTITNYTDLAAYKPTPLPGERVLHICVFGRYDPQKNCMRFVEAIKQLKEQTQQKFVIEWFGNQHFKERDANPFYVEMKRKVDEYGLRDCLLLNDQIKDVAGAMTRFDAFCLPSLWEGFSNAISEALCCGKPCLVSDVADNGVMVKDGVNGFLFDPRRDDAIVVAFLNFFALSPDERQAMGNVSRKRAEELFNKEKYIYAYEKLFNSIT